MRSGAVGLANRIIVAGGGGGAGGGSGFGPSGVGFQNGVRFGNGLVTITYTPVVNDAPVNTVPGEQSTDEETALTFNSAN